MIYVTHCLNLAMKLVSQRLIGYLKKLELLKSKIAKNYFVYKIPNEPTPPLMTDNISSLVMRIVSNETTVVIETSPGSAQLVARVLDYNKNSFEIIGIVAGDDTLFVVPSTIKNTEKLRENIEKFFIFKNFNFMVRN